LPLLKHKGNRPWRHKIEDKVASWWQVLEARADQSANPIHPHRLFCEVSSKLTEHCIITANFGSSGYHTFSTVTYEYQNKTI
jgi:pyruvate dehydrogenase (quinone)